VGSHSLQAAGAFEGGVPRHTAAKARSWLTGAWSESPDSGQRFRFRCCASLFDAFSPHSAPRRVSALLADTSTSCAWPARRADKRWSQDTSFYPAEHAANENSVGGEGAGGVGEGGFKKLVALVPVRDEAHLLESCLQALAHLVHAIVVMVRARKRAEEFTLQRRLPSHL
jgi:hypothetical protein